MIYMVYGWIDGTKDTLTVPEGWISSTTDILMVHKDTSMVHKDGSMVQRTYRR